MRADASTQRVIAGLVLVALALRPQILAIGPLLPAIRADLGISHGVAGLLGTIPVLCMGVFAPLGPRLARRIGPRLAIGSCVATIAAFGVLRAVAPGAGPVIALTLGIGLGMGMAGPILPMVVRVRVPGRPATATGAYAGGIVMGSTIAAAVAIPLAGPDGDWRRALAIVSGAAVASLVAWLVTLPRDERPASTDRDPVRLPWRERTAWALALVFGLQSVLYYGVVSWLPNVYVERGWTDGESAALLAVVNGAGILTTVGVPLLADRAGSRRAQLLASSFAALAGLLGVVLVPALGWAWAIVLGLALGAIFPLVLTLPVDVADRPADVGAAAALMLLAGYILSSTGPVALGVARDVTGDFGASLWLLVVIGAVLVLSCLVLSPARLRRGIRGSPEPPTPAS